jgi:5'-nucleotidase
MSSSKSTLDRKFDKRQTPQGRDYYWLAGEFVNQDKGEELMNGLLVTDTFL